MQSRGRILEGLCDDQRDRRSGIRIRSDDAKTGGIERLEVQLVGRSFSRHRHDTYAIGITVSGVQTFFHRGEQRHSLRGQCHILHPDEVHDGAAGTETGFQYRIAYIDPALVQQALGGRSHPFITDPVIDSALVPGDLRFSLWRLDDPIDAVGKIDLVFSLSMLLRKMCGEAANAKSLRLQSLLRVKELIAADPTRPHPVTQLEAISGLNRWELAQQFRMAFGTSPTSFRTMRQLENVRGFIENGVSLSEAGLLAGFSDQSHMSRMFKRTYGLTPSQWTAGMAHEAERSGRPIAGPLRQRQ